MKNNKNRLFEVLSKIDKSFKQKKLNESEDSLYNINSQEHGNEGSSYKAKLEEIVDFAKNIYKYLPEEQIPSWIQDKIVIAKENLSDVSEWIHSEEEENEGNMIGNHREMDDDEEHEEKQ